MDDKNVILHISQYLSVRDFITLLKCSKKLYELYTDENMWNISHTFRVKKNPCIYIFCIPRFTPKYTYPPIRHITADFCKLQNVNTLDVVKQIRRDFKALKSLHIENYVLDESMQLNPIRLLKIEELSIKIVFPYVRCDIEFLTGMNLKKLELSGTNLSSDKYLISLTSLTHLSLRNDYHEDYLLKNFTKLTSLTTLEMRTKKCYLRMYNNLCSSLTNKAMMYISQLTLKKLVLCGTTGISDSGLKYIQEIKSLEILHLHHMRGITDQSFAHIKHMKKLKELALRYCPNIQGCRVNELSECQIEVLNLSRNVQLRSHIFEKLNYVPSLKKLVIKNCGFTLVDMRLSKGYEIVC
ncbi:MAG TPA: hypothetical protein VLE02_01610 [Nitrosarchaeum sp.]|nr:hypothetical protein [Nitrosarchaeum sp.]